MLFLHIQMKYTVHRWVFWMSIQLSGIQKFKMYLQCHPWYLNSHNEAKRVPKFNQQVYVKPTSSNRHVWSSTSSHKAFCIGTRASLQQIDRLFWSHRGGTIQELLHCTERRWFKHSSKSCCNRCPLKKTQHGKELERSYLPCALFRAHVLGTTELWGLIISRKCWPQIHHFVSEWKSWKKQTEWYATKTEI